MIRPAIRDDAETWVLMRSQLWPGDEEEHRRDVQHYFNGKLREPLEVLLAFDNDEAVGFAEVNIRMYAEGCYSGRVAYLEGWFVKEEYRKKGFGGALIRAAEAWGRENRCTELASDTEIANIRSAAVHKRFGFEEVERIICFRKDLT